MNKFEKDFLGLLVKKYKFYIKSFYSNTFKEEKWIAITEGSTSIYAVMVSNGVNGEALDSEAKSYLSTITTKSIVVNTVEIQDETLIYTEGSYNKIIFSIKDRKVVYSNESCKLLIPILGEMFKVNKNKVERKNNSLITNILIVINVVIFIISVLLSGDLLDINGTVLVFLGAKVNYLINQGQVWRLITCAFLHGGLTHIFFNMYALKIMGPDLEYVYGRAKFLIIYLSSAVVASIFSYLLGPDSISVGASGAIFGMFGAMLIFGIKHRNKIGKAYIMNILKVILINIFIGVTMSNIDNAAHFGGLIAGAIISVCVGERRK